MKKRNILLLLLLAALLMASFLLIGDLSSYASIQQAKQHPGKEVSIICRLDTTQSFVYDALTNSNYCSFFVTDSLGETLHAIYRNSKPTDIERADKLVLKGTYQAGEDHQNGIFECKEILLKCPSKYNDGGQKLITSSTH